MEGGALKVPARNGQGWLTHASLAIECHTPSIRHQGNGHRRLWLSLLSLLLSYVGFGETTWRGQCALEWCGSQLSARLAALELIDPALPWELLSLRVLTDSFYSNDFDFRLRLRECPLPYAVQVWPRTVVCV